MQYEDHEDYADHEDGLSAIPVMLMISMFIWLMIVAALVAL